MKANFATEGAQTKVIQVQHDILHRKIVLHLRHILHWLTLRMHTLQIPCNIFAALS